MGNTSAGTLLWGLSHLHCQGLSLALPPRCVIIWGRAGPISRLPNIWSLYLAAWESTWYPGGTEQHADYLAI